MRALMIVPHYDLRAKLDASAASRFSTRSQSAELEAALHADGEMASSRRPAPTSPELRSTLRHGISSAHARIITDFRLRVVPLRCRCGLVLWVRMRGGRVAWRRARRLGRAGSAPSASERQHA